MKDSWLPLKYDIDGKKLERQLYCGSKWQIYEMSDGSKSILALEPLAEKWIGRSFLDRSDFQCISFGNTPIYAFNVTGQSLLFPLEESIYPESLDDALAFAHAMRRTRSLDGESSFHDAIYVEKLSLLLPTWSVSEQKNDAQVLGEWLTSGVNISTDSFKRLSGFVSWLDKEYLQQVIHTAGLEYHKGDDELPDTPAIKEKKQFSLPGRPALETFFNDYIIDIVTHQERYKRLGIDFPSAVILYGPPGCGKTFAAEKLVDYLDWPCYVINSGSIGSPYIHDTSKKINEIFSKAMDNAPSVVLIDEMEAYVSNRNDDNSGSKSHIEEVSEFLRLIPKAVESKVLIIGMTNYLDMIDAAIKRRGRFEHLVEVGMPSEEEVRALVGSLLNKLPTDNDLDLEPLIKQMTEKPLSDCSSAIREAARIAAKEGKDLIDQESLDAALDVISAKEDKTEDRKIGF